MIQWLKIKNLALVQDAEIELENGMNIISGETGAGKSVVVSAISILFGARADKSIIRTGENRCEISGGVRVENSISAKISQMLKENSIDSEKGEELIFRRVITSSSSRSFINDTGVTLDTLNSISDMLLDFHGQEEHQSLLNNNNILYLLDLYGGALKQREKVGDLFVKLKELEKELAELEKDIPNSSEAEYLRFMLSEISAIDPQPDEDSELYAKFKVLSNSKSIMESLYKAMEIIYDGEDSASNSVSIASRNLLAAEKIDEENIRPLLESADNISSLLKDLSYDIEAYLSKIELDEASLSEIETRMSEISKLKKKYGPSIEDVLNNKDIAGKKLCMIDNTASLKDKLLKSIENQKDLFLKEAALLSEERKKTGSKFASETVKKLLKLGFSHPFMELSISETSCSLSGIDKIEILFSANQGERRSPLKSVASSGELSRIMLAIKSVLSGADMIPTLIFDEIDANIGGEIANQVGSELKKLGTSHQIICISHLPQVASFGDTHFMVKKETKEGRTYTTITHLSEKERILELARMMGGGSESVAHASAILKKNHSN